MAPASWRNISTNSPLDIPQQTAWLVEQPITTMQAGTKFSDLASRRLEIRFDLPETNTSGSFRQTPALYLIPDSMKHGPIRTHARVAYSSPASSGRWHVGLAFTSLSPEDQARLLRFTMPD